MLKPKVSIIIPVNNLENYIRKSLESVVKQTLKEIEIICVDDASSDSSANIIKEFMKKDSRIKLVENRDVKGQAYARNLGLNIAKGEYIGFVDGDDWVDVQMFEKMYEKAKSKDSEITMCSTNIFDEYKQSLSKENNYYNLCIFDKSLDDITFSHLDVPELILDINVAVWNKIYKKEFLKKIKAKFKEGYIYEDMPFFYETYLKAQRISLVRDFLYFYRINRFGSTMSNMKRKILDRVDMVAYTYNLFKSLPYFKEIKAKLVGWVMDDLFHRYTLVDPKYKREFFYRMKKTFLDLDLSGVDKKMLESVYCYKEFSFVTKESYEEINKRFFGVFNTCKEEKNDLVSKHNEAMVALNQSFLREKEKEKREFDKNVAQLQSRFKEEYEIKLDIQKKAHETELVLKNEQHKQWLKNETSNLKQKYLEDCTAQKALYEERLISQKKIYDSDLKLLKEWFESELINRLAEQKKHYSDELNTKLDQQSMLLENEKNIQLAAQKDKIETALNAGFEAKELEKEAEFSSFKNKLQLDFDGQFAVQESQYEIALSNLENQLHSEYEEKLASIKEKNEDDITELKNQFELELVDKISLTRQEGEGELNVLKEQLEAEKQTELFNQSQYYEEEIVAKLVSQKDWFESEIDRRIAEVDVWHNQNLEENLSNQRIFFETQIEELNNKYSTDLNMQKEDANKERDFQINAQKERFEEELRNQKKYYDEQLQNQKDYYEKEISHVRFILKVVKKIKNIIRKIKRLFVKPKNEPLAQRPKVSVILPVYNVDKYLKQSLDSLLNQSLKEIEIICVNDGSTDNSASILEDYKQRDTRIKVIHKQNAGTGAARNDGLKIATGECIGFVDPDDWVKENMFERLYSLLKEKDVDIVMCTPSGFDEKNQIEADFPYFVDANFKKELENKIFSWKDISPFSYPMCVWNKLYKKELFDKYNIDFAEGLDFEDHKVIFKSLLTAEKIFFIREKLYVYRFNRVGSVLSDNNNRLIDHIKIFDIVENILNETGTMTKFRKDFVFYKIHNLLYYYGMIKEEFKHDYCSKMKDSIRETNLTEAESHMLYKSYPELEQIINEINN